MKGIKDLLEDRKAVAAALFLLFVVGVAIAPIDVSSEKIWAATLVVASLIVGESVEDFTAIRRVIGEAIASRGNDEDAST